MKENTSEQYTVDVDGTEYTISFSKDENVVIVDGEVLPYDIRLETPPDHYSLLLDGKSYLVTIEPEDDPGKFRVHAGGYDFNVEAISQNEAYLREFILAAGVGKKDGIIKAPMPGLIVKLLVAEGEGVEKGQGIMVMEAMKMENEIKATHEGSISKIHVTEGDAVEKGQVLIEIA